MNSLETASSDTDFPGDWKPRVFQIFLACVIGGYIGGSIIHQVHPIFAYEQLPPIDFASPPELIEQHHAAAFAYQTRNYAAEFAIVGLGFGFCIGTLAGGKRFIPVALGAGCVGALTGLGLGYASGLYIAQRLLTNAEQTMQTSMGLQTIVWGGVLANSLGFVAIYKVGLVRSWKYWIVGLAAGFSIAAVQFVASSLMFPTSDPIFLVPEKATERVYWLALFPVIAGVVMALGLSKLTRPLKS